MTYGPPPAPPPYQVPPEKPRRNLRTVLIVVAVVGLLCCGVGTAGGVWLFRTVQDATEAPREATHAFLGELRAGDYDRAYDQLCGPTRQGFSRADFAQIAQELAEVTEYRLTGVHVSTVNRRTTGTVTARLTLVDGSTVTHEFPLVKEGDDWRVCGQPY